MVAKKIGMRFEIVEDVLFIHSCENYLKKDRTLGAVKNRRKIMQQTDRVELLFLHGLDRLKECRRALR